MCKVGWRMLSPQTDQGTVCACRELRPDLNCFVKWVAIVAGHIGFCGRGGTFLLVAILFFRTIGEDTGDETTIANALYQLEVCF